MHANFLVIVTACYRRTKDAEVERRVRSQLARLAKIVTPTARRSFYGVVTAAQAITAQTERVDTQIALLQEATRIVAEYTDDDDGNRQCLLRLVGEGYILNEEVHRASRT